MKEIFYYFKLYRQFLNVSFSEGLSFRTSFILLILMDIFFYLSSFATVSFIYDHIETIGPWDRDHLMFFIAFMIAIDHFHMTFLSESFWHLSRHIKQGDLDYILLRPAHSIFSVFFRHIRPSSMFNTPLVWGALIYFGMQIPLSLDQWILLPFLLLLAFTLLAVLEILISTAMFWVKEGMGINFLRMQMQALSRWPEFIYQNIYRRIFLFFFPILLIGSAPIHFLYDYSRWDLMLLMIFLLLLFIKILFWTWNIALNRYESASS